MRETDPVYIAMKMIVWSEAGTIAAVKATTMGSPALCGVDPLVVETLGEAYRKEDGPMNLGFLVAARMRDLGFVEVGKGLCAPECLASEGTVWGIG